jgi:hypothetical protein
VKLRVPVGLAALAAGLLIWTAPEEHAARFTPEGELILPEGVERWVAVGASLWLGYSEAEVRRGEESFHTVLLEPGAYEHYRRGRFATSPCSPWSSAPRRLGQRGAGATARPFPPARCARWHAEHAGRDNVFLQFYPLLQER